jgi:hypothetical protein
MFSFAPILYIMKKIHLSYALLLIAFCLGCNKNEPLPNNGMDKITGNYNGSTIRTTTITTYTSWDTTVNTTIDTLSITYQVQRYNADTILVTSFHSIGDLQVPYTGNNNITFNTIWGVQKVTFTPGEGKAEVYDSTRQVTNGGSGVYEAITRFVGNK